MNRMTQKELEALAQTTIHNKIERGEIVQMPWAVQELINSQGEIVGDGASFFYLCADNHVYRAIKKAVDKYEKTTNKKDGGQLNLEGYDYLQCAYTVNRDDERCLVPINRLSDDELHERADEYRSQSKGMIKHAEEIDLYIAERQSDIAV